MYVWGRGVRGVWGWGVGLCVGMCTCIGSFSLYCPRLSFFLCPCMSYVSPSSPLLSLSFSLSRSLSLSLSLSLSAFERKGGSGSTEAIRNLVFAPSDRPVHCTNLSALIGPRILY